MEVKLGVQHAPREVVFESNQTQEEVESSVTEAIQAGRLVTLTDAKGGRVLVPSDKVAYIEVGATTERKVGFGAM